MGRGKNYRPGRMMLIPEATSYQYATPTATRSSMSKEIATRQTTWNTMGTGYNLSWLPNPSEVLRNLGKDIAEYKYLLEDSHVNGCMESRIAGTLSLQWTLDANGAPTEQYDAIKAILDSWPQSDIMHEILYATFFGYQPVEIMWSKQGGLVLPRLMVPKDPDWFRFSEENELRYLSSTDMVRGQPLPPYKFIVPRYRPSYERPYGRPLGSVVYWAVKFRHAGIRFYTQFVEKFGSPWIRAEYPLGAQQARVQQMMDMLEATVQDGIIAHPSEYKVEALKMNDGSSADIHEKYIQLMNEEIAIGILGQTLTTKMDKSGGSFAAAKVHATVRDDIVGEDKKIVEAVYNTLISWIYEINWAGSDVRPVFKLIAAPNPTLEDAQMAVALANTGIKFTNEYYQNRFNLMDTEFEITDRPVQPIETGVIKPDTLS